MLGKEDVESRGWLEWMKAHTPFMKPLHRYEGELRLDRDKLVFEGQDKKRDDAYAIEIEREDVNDLYLGYDDTFKMEEEESIGLFVFPPSDFRFNPLRIKYEKNNKDQTRYIITDFSRFTRSTNNEEWYETLRDWVEKCTYN